MNRKGFLKTLGAMFALPFVTPAMTVEKQLMEKMPKPVQKQTKIEQKTLEKFYSKEQPIYALSGVYTGISITGSYPISGYVDPAVAARLRSEGIWK